MKPFRAVGCQRTETFLGISQNKLGMKKLSNDCIFIYFFLLLFRKSVVRPD